MTAATLSKSEAVTLASGSGYFHLQTTPTSSPPPGAAKLSSVVCDVDSDICLAGNAGPFLDHDILAGVVVLCDAMARNERVYADNVDLQPLRLCNDRFHHRLDDGHAVPGCFSNHE
jgi:hypothetical protein